MGTQTLEKTQTPAFTSAGGFQTSGKARRDENGTYFNAIGLEATEEHQHVSVIWQRKCIPLADFANDVYEQQKFKFDRKLTAQELMLTPDLTLSDGTGFTLSGLMTMPTIGMKQGVIEYLAQTVSGYPDASGQDVSRAKSDLAHYLNMELSLVSGQRDGKLSERLEKKQAQLKEDNVPSTDKRLREEIQDIQQRLNDSQKFTVRTRNDDDGNQVVRYIGSEKYGVINNAQVLEMISNALPGGYSDCLVSHGWNDGDSMVGNLLLPDYIKNRPDSEYGSGLSIKNSETGRFRFTVAPFLFRAICLNGCIWGRENATVSIDKKHLGHIDMDAIQTNVINAVNLALSQGEQLLGLFDITKEITVTNQKELVASLSQDNKLTLAQGRAWLKAIEKEPGDTVFHTIQGLTLAAQSFTGDVRQNMEETAGLILAPSLTADIDAIAALWQKFSVRAEGLNEKQVEAYVR